MTKMQVVPQMTMPQLVEYLKRAQVAHHNAVVNGVATDDDWPEWYAERINIWARSNAPKETRVG